MAEVKWLEEVRKRKDRLIETTRRFLQINSVRDEQTAREGAPFGEGIARALEFVLQVCAEAGMATKNVEGYAGHAELGQGTELIGVLSHVDVVPAGEGWSVPPFAAEIREGKLIARGALDDKGATMAVVWAAAIIKELGLPLKKRVRLIFGTDEETSWRCVKRYFETEEMPQMGFSPDADFPLIYAEKGLTHLIFRQSAEAAREAFPLADTADARLHRLEAGMRVNMVPDRAEAFLIPLAQSAGELVSAYRSYLEQANLSGEASRREDKVRLVMNGRSAHGMDPAKGINAGTELLRFLSTLVLDQRAARLARFAARYLHRQHDGAALGIAARDEEMGPLTLNTGIIRYAAEGEAEFHLNIRYPSSAPFERWQATLAQTFAQEGFSLEVADHMPPHRVDPNHPLITTLQRVYAEQTGTPANLIAIGGATYARSLAAGVAFGPLFPGRPDCAHQRDEHMDIEDLVRATAIYAQAIYELAKD